MDHLYSLPLIFATQRSKKSDQFLLRTTSGVQIWRRPVNTNFTLFLLELTRKLYLLIKQGDSDPKREFKCICKVQISLADNNGVFFAWFPAGDAFCCVNGSSVKKFVSQLHFFCTNRTNHFIGYQHGYK